MNHVKRKTSELSGPPLVANGTSNNCVPATRDQQRRQTGKLAESGKLVEGGKLLAESEACQREEERPIGQKRNQKLASSGEPEEPEVAEQKAQSPTLRSGATNSNSSAETVIARLGLPADWPQVDARTPNGTSSKRPSSPGSSSSSSQAEGLPSGQPPSGGANCNVNGTGSGAGEQQETSSAAQEKQPRGRAGRTLRSWLGGLQQAGQRLAAYKLRGRHGQAGPEAEGETREQAQWGESNNPVVSFAQRYLLVGGRRGRTSSSAPATPLHGERARPAAGLGGGAAVGTQTGGSLERLAVNMAVKTASKGRQEESVSIVAGGRPSVRFVNLGAEPKDSEQQGGVAAREPEKGPPTPPEDKDEEEEFDGAALVARLFNLDAEGRPRSERVSEGPATQGETTNATNAAQEEPGESPMDSAKFRLHGYRLIDYICNYLDTIRRRRVTPINIEPGYLKSLIEPEAPERGQPFGQIMMDFERKIMCGITHWQHPHFHAYFPAGNAFPSILADMLSDALGCVGFSWAASPAYTELEIIMLDWMGKMIGLPDQFLCLAGSSRLSSTGSSPSANTPSANSSTVNSPSGENSPTGSPTGNASLPTKSLPTKSSPTGSSSANEDSNQQGSKGGGVIQGSASECVLVSLLAARHWAMEKLRRKFPGTAEGLLLSRLIGYCSKEAHSCVEKAAMIGFIRMRALDTDERHSLRGDTLRRAIEADKQAGLEPFIVCATLGTTSCVSFDNLEELGQVCQAEDELWLHVDAAYAGSALICPEFKYLMRGIELATSFNMNPNKWMLINFDCSLMWVKDRFKLTRAFVVDPLYLQHSFSDQAIDYRHWGIPLSRRFRALKLWFVIRNYGVEGLRAYIRNHCRLAKLFEQLIRQDQRFTVTNEVVLGLVCFRLVGSNALNQRLLSMINASGKLHMVPASLNGRYVIRFCVCEQNARDQDIHYAYKCIADTASELLAAIKAGRERIRAISQQNTIDVSSISLHTQQSTGGGGGGSTTGERAALGQPAAHAPLQSAGAGRAQQPADAENAQQAAGARARAPAEDALPPLAARGPLTKQASVRPPPGQSQAASESSLMLDECSTRAELPIDSLASIDGRDFDLELDLDEVAPGEPSLPPETVGRPANGTGTGNGQDSGQPLGPLGRPEDCLSTLERELGGVQSVQTARDCMSPVQRALEAADEREEADEMAKLAGRRNRMPLRYKREFFVRVVSDPRVYRASISGDINAHQPAASLALGQASNSQASNSQAKVPQAQSQAQVSLSSRPASLQDTTGAPQ